MLRQCNINCKGEVAVQISANGEGQVLETKLLRKFCQKLHQFFKNCY